MEVLWKRVKRMLLPFTHISLSDAESVQTSMSCGKSEAQASLFPHPDFPNAMDQDRKLFGELLDPRGAYKIRPDR